MAVGVLVNRARFPLAGRLRSAPMKGPPQMRSRPGSVVWQEDTGLRTQFWAAAASAAQLRDCSEKA